MSDMQMSEEEIWDLAYDSCSSYVGHMFVFTPSALYDFLDKIKSAEATAIYKYFQKISEED